MKFCRGGDDWSVVVNDEDDAAEDGGAPKFEDDREERIEPDFVATVCV